MVLILSVVVMIVVDSGAALAIALVVNVKDLYLAPHWVLFCFEFYSLVSLIGLCRRLAVMITTLRVSRSSFIIAFSLSV